MKINYTVQESDENIKQILKNKFNMSDRYILKLKKNQCILINSLPVYINYKIKPSDILQVVDSLEEDSSNIVPNELIKLNILFEDEYLLIVDKPAGIPVHPSILHYENSLSNGVKYYFDKIGLKKKIRPVNRLDKDTSGIVIFAKNEYIQECLVKQMKSEVFKKYYIAILEGHLEKDSGVIEASITRKEDSIIERKISPSGAKAVSHYNVIKKFSVDSVELTEVEFLLETGRTHQIRLHSKYIGHPVLGDYLYGSKSDLISRHALHAYKVEFIHPIFKTPISIKSKLPSDILNLINK